MFAVDTSGPHKGKPLARDARLVLQLGYTSALFGTDYSRRTLPADGFSRCELAQHPHYHSRFTLEA